MHDQVNAICGDVWFDETRLSPGDWWSEEIEKAIERCRLFLPIISRNTDLEEEGYIFREWNLAADRLQSIAPGSGRRLVIPVFIDDPPDDPADYRVMPKGFRTLNVGYAPSGNLDLRLRSILETEIRAIRRPGAA